MSYAEVVAVTQQVLGADVEVLSLRPNLLQDIGADIRSVGKAAGRLSEADMLLDALFTRVNTIVAETIRIPQPPWPDPSGTVWRVSGGARRRLSASDALNERRRHAFANDDDPLSRHRVGMSEVLYDLPLIGCNGPAVMSLLWPRDCQLGRAHDGASPTGPIARRIRSPIAGHVVPWAAYAMGGRPLTAA